MPYSFTHVWLIASLALILVSASLFNSFLAKRDDRGIGERFHYDTRLTLTGVAGSLFRWKARPPQYKTYADRPSVRLTPPTFKGVPLEEAIRRRRSERDFSGKAMSIEELSQLLYAASGITGQSDSQPLRSAPSAGALYPIETYVVVNNVEGLSMGLYHYNVPGHTLELLKEGNFKGKITHCALDQEMAGQANVTFILTAIFDRTTWKYDERGYRYAYIEAGHISQNLYLQATSLGLGSVAIGAFYDDSLNKLLDVDGKTEAAIYMHAVGKK
jgi:SagB-type dehydrogenase family enzyme